jgi:polyhydroxybutyrate depolymerase
VSASETAQFWAGVDGCRGEQSEKVPDQKSNETTVTVHRFMGCRSEAQVILYEIHGGGHNWPGGSVPKWPIVRHIVGNVSQEIQATTIILEFFKQYGLLDQRSPAGKPVIRSR